MGDVKKPRLEDGVANDQSGEGDPEYSKAVEQLESLQEELDKVNDEASEKVLQVEQHYNKVRRPIYLKRNEVISQVEGFWKAAFLNHPVLSDLITEDDEEALSNLTEVMVDDSDDIKSGFKITFRFKENPYFNDSELQKSVNFAEDGTLHVDGTPPDWKEGMGPSDEGATTSGKRTRGNVYSLFQWFVESGTLDSGQQDEIAAIIKDEIWPNPLKYQNDVEEFDTYGADPAVEEYDEEEGDEEFDEEGLEEGYPVEREDAEQQAADGEVPDEYEDDEEGDDDDDDQEG